MIFAKALLMEWVKIFADEKEAKQRITERKPQLLVVHGKRICLVLLKDTFYAVQDACSHNGESLSKGTLNFLGEIICPWHNYRFDLQSGRESASRSKDLVTFPIKSDESGFYIGV